MSRASGVCFLVPFSAGFIAVAEGARYVFFCSTTDDRKTCVSVSLRVDSRQPGSLFLCFRTDVTCVSGQRPASSQRAQGAFRHGFCAKCDTFLTPMSKAVEPMPDSAIVRRSIPRTQFHLAVRLQTFLPRGLRQSQDAFYRATAPNRNSRGGSHRGSSARILSSSWLSS